MGARPPKLLALDLDGTLLDTTLTLRPRVKRAVGDALACGIAVSIVTGRMYGAARPFVRELGLHAPIICYQGASIVDPNTEAILRSVPLPNATVRQLIDTGHADDVHLQLYTDDRYYVEAQNVFSALYASLTGVEPTVVPSLAERFRTAAAIKAVFIAPADIAQSYAPRLRERYAGRAYVTRSYPEFVEVLNPDVNKGVAVRFVAERLGIERDAILAVGDSWNDVPLFRAAAFSVAMGSAPPELRALADASVADAANDGVAEAIERYVLR